LSFQGERTSGQSQARRRGRVYLGPFGSSAGDTTSGRPSSGLRGGIITAAAAFGVQSQAAIEWVWGVISTAGPSMSFSEVKDGWVDDAWDTQRRRGEGATLRTTFTVY